MSKDVIDLVAGARPNFMKLAPVVRALKGCGAALAERELSWRIVHTGQHYDQGMNDVFFSELGIPEPDVNLNAGSGSTGSRRHGSWSVMKRIYWRIIWWPRWFLVMSIPRLPVRWQR